VQRTVLITGASRGIGQEIARQLHQAGFRLFLTGRDVISLDRLKQQLGCDACAADLNSAEETVRLYAAARTALGKIDVLVNNAGINRAKTPIRNLTVEELDESYAVNVRAPILLAREALQDMAHRGNGHIVNIVSTVVYARMENYSAYTAMKSALDAFTGCLIKEARNVGVKVTAVYPGGTNTAFRPNPRPDYLSPASVAQMVVQAILAPADVVVHNLTFRPIVETNF
jgi:short-subunit dehydrogenase